MTLNKPFVLALMLAGIAALILPASSQQPGPEQLFDPPPHQKGQPGGAPKAVKAKAAPKAKADPADPDVPPRAKAKAPPPKAAPAETLVGTWAGKVTQLEHQGYTVVLTVRPGAASSEYPELACSGTLSRLAGSGPYVFYLEKITRGRHDAGGRCPDGTVVIARAGDKLGFSWYGSVEGHAIFVYGALTRR